MKKLIFLLLLLLPFLSFSQSEKRYKSIIIDSVKALNAGSIDFKDTSRFEKMVSIGGSLDTSAILTLTDTGKGLLIPRLTTAQRDSIGSPTTGLLIYNTTTNQVEFFETIWKTIAEGAFVKLTGDTMTGILKMDNVAIQTNTINEFTAAAGITIDDVLLKDKRVLIPDTGALVVGHSAQVAFGEVTSEVQILGTTETDASLAIGLWNGADVTLAPSIKFLRSIDTLIGENFESVFDDDALGKIQAYGSDDVDLNTLVAEIAFNVEGETNPGAIGGKILLKTATSGGTLTTALIINNSQNIGINQTVPTARLHVNGIDAATNNFALKVQDNVGTELFNVRNDGKIGINTASPDLTLTVNGDANITDGNGFAIGFNALIEFGGVTSESQILGTAEADASLAIGLWSVTDTLAPSIRFLKSANADIDDPLDPVINDESLGKIQAYGSDENFEALVAEIAFNVDDTLPTPGAVGGEIILKTATNAGTLTTALVIDNSQNVSIVGNLQGGTISTTASTEALGVSATTFAVTSNVMTITGDGGANTIATITGANSGQYLILIFVDALVSITDDSGHGADTVDLSGSFTSADDTVLHLIYDGVSFYEISRSTN